DLSVAQTGKQGRRALQYAQPVAPAGAHVPPPARQAGEAIAACRQDSRLPRQDVAGNTPSLPAGRHEYQDDHPPGATNFVSPAAVHLLRRPAILAALDAGILDRKSVV